MQIDDALRALPIHLDDLQVYEPDAPLYSNSKATLLGAVAEHYTARGGATMRLRSPARHDSPAFAEVVAEDAEFGSTTAVFRVGGRLTLDSTTTAAGTDLSGHPGYNALTAIEGVTPGHGSHGMAGIAEVNNRLYYELEDGSRLEITRHPGRTSSDVWGSHDPEDTGHADYYEDTESSTSDFYPATLRATVDRAVSGYVFARSAREDLGARSLLQYQNLDTDALVDGFTVSEIPISMTVRR